MTSKLKNPAPETGTGILVRCERENSSLGPTVHSGEGEHASKPISEQNCAGSASATYVMVIIEGAGLPLASVISVYTRFSHSGGPIVILNCVHRTEIDSPRISG